MASGVDIDEQRRQFISEAIALARHSINQGGGPFGAVVVRDGVVIGRGHNRVTLRNDPSAHAEVEAIRDACKKQGDFQLVGCALYASCMPCPMCLSTAYWAHIDNIYYAATAGDAAAAGFDDEFIARELALPIEQRTLPQLQLVDSEAQEIFRIWQQSDTKVEY